MITPVRIRVRNIRSVRDGEITIPETGITALHGPVGSGKSTFLSAMVWALYGEVPGGLKQSDMRRTGADGEPCEAEVEFLFNGQRYKALRGLRQRGLRSGVREEAYARWWTPGATGPGQDERQMTPSKLTLKITELTGLTGRAYAGAFYIAQGELASLAEGTPGQVQQLFEEQTGLGVLTKKVDEKNAEARRAEERAAAMPGSREETDEARQALDKAQNEAAGAHDLHQGTADAAAKAAERLRLAEERDDAAQREHRRAEQSRIVRARGEERVQQCKQRRTALTEELAEAGAEALDPQVIEVQLDRLRQAVQSAERAVQQAEAAEDRASVLAKRAKEVQAEVTRLATPELDRQIAAAQQQQADQERRRGALRGEFTRLSRALEALTTTERACCPTCVQPLRDARALVSDLHQQRERCISEGMNAKATAEAASRLHDVLLSRRQELTQVTARLDAIRTESDAARRQAESMRQAVAAPLATVAAHLPGNRSLAHEGEVMTRGRMTIEQLSADLSRAHRVDALRNQLTKVQSDLDSAEADLAASTATHIDLAPEEPGKAAGELIEARREHGAATTAASEANTRFRVLAERVSVLEQAHQDAESRMRAKAEQTHQAHILHEAAALLAELRRELLADYTGVVSQAATDVLTQITDRHVRFEIDESFIPRVHTAEGTVRPTRVLSGGEKATAALAFRLGITEQITERRATGMIIADEITAAHDADTRRAALTCLSELGWPALVVSHGEEITETAQQVISLRQPDERIGTVIEPAA
ncbi:AAA family ATPase [Streptomyces sp. NPDC054865]